MQITRGMFKKKVRLLCVFVVPVFLFLLPGIGTAATYYMPDDFHDLHSALSHMSGGDTLIIRDGVYKGPKNTIDGTYLPPSGFNGKYTIIKAEHDWKVVFDGENQEAMFYSWVGRHHVQFEGIKWINNNDASPHIYQWDHIKFLRCAFNCGSNAIRVSTVWVSQSSYILFEDCHAWGDGRYSLNIQTSDHVVVRRFVSRLDAVNGSKEGAAYPAANFISYASQDVEWQNCIAIDTDQDFFRSPASYYLGAFATHVLYQNEYTEKNYYRGCIALNIDMHEPNPSYPSSPGPGFLLDRVRSCEYYSCIVWNVVGRGFSGSSLSGYPSKIDHCTARILPDPNGHGDVVNVNSTVSVTNSVLLNANRAGIRGGATSNYNCLYRNASNYSSGSSGGAHDITNVDPIDGDPGNGNPALKYICRIEAVSDLRAHGSSGDIGANVLTKIGVDGTLYGEVGYNQDTGNPIWPYPFEDVIREDFRSYAGPPSGTRGFCGEGRTLTKYIWESLGNPIPSEIYRDGTPPHAEAGEDLSVVDYDKNGNEEITLDGSQSHDPDGEIVSYKWLENGTQIAVGISPKVVIPVGTHKLDLLVTDNDGLQDSDSVTITVNQDSNNIIRKINFQPSNSPVPDGYIADYGLVFDESRGFGWETNVPPSYFRERNVNLDQKLDTFVIGDDNLWTWEMALPNGNYLITLSVGDPEHARGKHRVKIEGVEALNEATMANEYLLLKDYLATVNDGRLSIQIGGGQPIGGEDPWGLTCLNYIIIRSTDDTTPPGDVTDVTATPGTNQVTLSWKNPSDSDFAGVMIRFRTDGTYPTGHTDGTEIPNGNNGKIPGQPSASGSYVHTGLDSNKTYYYSIFTYDIAGNYSNTAHVSASPLPANQAPSITFFTAQPNPAGNPLTTVTFSVQASDPDGDALTYTIDFGDNSPSVSGNTATHAYSSKKTYTATATVSDGQGHSVDKSLQVTVNDNAPAKVTGVQAQ